MIDWIKSKLILILSGLLALSLAYSSITTYLYQGSRNKLNALQTQYMSLLVDFKESEEDKANLKESNEASLEVVGDLHEDIKKKEEEKDSAIEALRNYKPKCPKPSTTGVVVNEEYVDIDAPYDPELLRLYQGSGQDNP